MKLVVLVLVSIIVAMGWGYYQLDQKMRDTEAQLAQMEAHALSLEKQVFELESKLAEKKTLSLEEMAQELNGNLAEGWQTILNEFKNRLEGANEKLREELQQEEQESNSQPKQPADERT